ncbi:RNI-like superfamily protein [Striga hermonthica]|uniref:RNI-like superfamily protein n=1 Tax=Striga hermonthica TaxID=68872 RepID=A0A9N7REA0_STRHE|nr:RNI-like superfamily protein [Striga hermonthica]
MGSPRWLTFLAHLIFLQQFRFSARALLNPVDFLALQSIRRGLSDLPGSGYFSTWDFTAEPCDFSGVYCDGDRVIALNLGDPRAGSPGLTGRIDPAVGKLSALAELTIVPGRVTGPLPETISQLKLLRFLAVSRNFISGEIPSGLGELRGLQTLDLSFNQLTGAIPISVGSLPALSNVVLSHNHLTGPVPPYNRLSGEISPMFSTVENLYLNNNRFIGRVPASIVDRLLAANIQTLYLQHNYLSGIGINPTVEIPLSSSLCLQYNCMVLPVETPCPLKAGPDKSRPSSQCIEWKG